ncbi:MAG: InlB B-repeat-containing protein, partial [Acutalibacteraceae bacterium]|nr:InlB B-repeat-containing protein [Acutalibacteraceae bacterium]
SNPNETAETSAAKDAAFCEKAQWSLDQIDPSWDDCTLALVLHDLLVANNYYGDVNGTNTNYTFMVGGYGVCENYAEVYAFLLARLGIKSEIVEGTAGGAHEWVRICLDGQYYNVDVTWDDPIGNSRPNNCRHKFFLLSDSLIQSSAYDTNPHTGYSAYYAADDTRYDSQNVKNASKIVALNGILYTIYEKASNNYVLASYDPASDSFSDLYIIDESWMARQEGNTTYYYVGNFSGLTAYNGQLYFNGVHTINSYNPVTNQSDTIYTDNTVQFFDLTIAENGVLHGWTGTAPSSSLTDRVIPTQTYTVTWQNYNGEVLENDYDVPAGTMPSYDGVTPTQPNSATEMFTFTGWSPAVSAVTGDVTYTATFTKTTREYTITWKMDDGSTIDTATVAYGQTPTHADAVKDADAQYTYTFTAWTPTITEVTGEATYTAQFTATPIQTETIYYLVGTMNRWAENSDYVFVRNEGCTTAEEYMLTNVELAANAEFKVKSSKNDWFPGGNTLNDTVTAAGTYTIYFRPNWDGTNKWYYGAIYAQNVTPYTVTFDPANNDAVTTQTVTYGNTATAPETAPAKYGYDFMGWYNGDEAYDFTPVTGDLTLTAHWREKQVSVTYTDINGINTVSFVGMVTGTYTLPSTPYLDGYDFDGWTVNSNPYTNKDAVLAQIDSLVKSESPVFVQVVYTKNEAQHTVSFDDGTEIGTYQVSDLVTITADTQSNGLTFDHWERIKSGTSTTVSYNAKYSFFMPDENVVLRAVYQEVPEAKGVAFIEKVTVNAADQKISFVAVCNVPQEYKMVKGGLVATNDAAIGADVSAEEGKYTFLKISTKTTENTKNLKYTWTKSNVNAGDTWYVKAYLVYTNTNNEEITVYSDAVTASLN